MFSTQFHPEANDDIVRRWSTGVGVDELLRIGTSADELLEATRTATAMSRVHSDRLVDWFCETIVPADFVNVIDTR